MSRPVSDWTEAAAITTLFFCCIGAVLVDVAYDQFGGINVDTKACLWRPSRVQFDPSFVATAGSTVTVAIPGGYVNVALDNEDSVWINDAENNNVIRVTSSGTMQKYPQTIEYLESICICKPRK